MKTRRAGFTLIEVLVAILLLVLISGIVYASFSSVMDVTEMARDAKEELHLRQFLLRSFTNNLACVFTDQGQQDPQFQLLGTSGTKMKSGAVSLDFCSSAALQGSSAPPGMLKTVHYGLRRSDNNAGKTAGVTAAPLALEANETLIVTPASDLFLSSTKKTSSSGKDSKSLALEGAASPSWSMPVEAADFSYYDGKEWSADWDSIAMGRMPWAIRVRINFVRNTTENAEERTLDDGADFDLTVPVPLGMGIKTDATSWMQYVASNQGNPRGDPPPQ